MRCAPQGHWVQGWPPAASAAELAGDGEPKRIDWVSVRPAGAVHTEACAGDVAGEKDRPPTPWQHSVWQCSSSRRSLLVGWSLWPLPLLLIAVFAFRQAVRQAGGVAMLAALIMPMHSLCCASWMRLRMTASLFVRACMPGTVMTLNGQFRFELM